ncbi:hypothetical protein FQN55_004780 [Onygenales sp. PD_40]|nr:hypothetical protein FQN55_004780 [Onygenales sp. PD_40]KAK2779958.1 hypothetical protein FQN53_001189 [Emmonsiellopsis sp. PD_33]KAK2789792.1 hypothetical protein FQN52_005918 [Onygenales sp. PD_12]
MGRIKKVAGQKHEATISPALATFVQQSITVAIPELPTHLATFPRRWPFPRGDLYHWIGVLNRFDDILQLVIEKYALDQGPQTKPFGRLVLEEACVSGGLASTTEESQHHLDKLGYGIEGDRELVEALLDFSRLLLDKCGNRSLYSSSERLNDLLNTTSLSLVQCVLRLGVNLAQRYFSRQRSSNSPHFHQTLLASHYNIDLERVQKLAAPFSKPPAPAKVSDAPPSVKGKEKAVQGQIGRRGSVSTTKCNANDLISLTKEITDAAEPRDFPASEWQEWGNVRMSYYSPAADNAAAATTEGGGHVAHPPTTPTPLRRTTSHPGSRGNRSSTADDSPSLATHSPAVKPDEPTRGMRVLEIPSSVILSTKIEQLLEEHQDLPKDARYELLSRLRVAYALATSTATRRQILSTRILAITNLAYVYSETTFQQKILQQDSDEPKRLQLAYQLAEFVHLGVTGDITVPTVNQTFALYALDALAKHKSRSADVCAALNVNVNHGILMFITRKAVADLAIEEKPEEGPDADDWRDGLFSLLRTLPNSGSRTPETLVAAGLIPLFVDILNLRTEKARRVYPRVMEFLDTFVHTVRDALATLAGAKGFHAISDLISSEAKTSFELVSKDQGIPAQFKTPSTDYQIPYFQQQSLRWLFKFVNHVMQHNSGGFERLLRNLIDSPPLLTALRLVLENARVYGSHVWSGAVNILSHFIHNEPTSYAVIAEAGLSKSLLEAVMGRPMADEPDASGEEGDNPSVERRPLFIPARAEPADHETLKSRLNRSPDRKLAEGILPSSEAIVCIPQAFGAICLNSTGLELFKKSDALESFFDIFESPEHVKCMKNDSNLVRILGSSFDELVRHHPALKSAVMSSVLLMVARVGQHCKSKAWERGLGTKLWLEGDDGKLSIAGGPSSVVSDIGAVFSYALGDQQRPPSTDSGDIEMQTSSTVSQNGDAITTPSAENWDFKDLDNHGLSVPNYMFPVVKFLGAFFENQTICGNFIESGGAEYVLDFATLQSLPFDFHNQETSQQLAQVIHLMAEVKPHLVLPSLVNRTQDALDRLTPFWIAPNAAGFFTPLTKASKKPDDPAESPESEDIKTKGTYFAKHLVAVHTLTDILREIYTPPIYPTRASHQTSPFVQVNLADKYVSLVKKLGALQSACVWEEILLQMDMPEAWNEATTVPEFGLDGEEGNEAPSTVPADDASEPGDAIEDATDAAASGTTSSGGLTNGESRPRTRSSRASVTASEKSAAFKNVKTLRYLLSSVPSSITAFLHLLGHGLLTKRRMDTYQRQRASSVADAIAATILEQLNLEAAKNTSRFRLRFAYLIVILSSFSQLLFDTTQERPHSHCLTMILFAFKKLNGLQPIKELSDLFLNEIKALAGSSGDMPTRLASAYGGIKIILTFFSQMTSAHYIIDSAQTQAMQSASTDRDRERPDYFHPAQFLVELRMEVIPMIQEMWSSSFVEDASSSIVKSLIEILRSVLDGEYEQGAFRRGETLPPVSSVSPRTFPYNRDRLARLKENGYDESLAREALYRCYNGESASEEYCSSQQGFRAPPRNPVPSYDQDQATSGSHGDNIFGNIVGSQQPDTAGSSRPETAASIATLLGQIVHPSMATEDGQPESPVLLNQHAPADDSGSNTSGLLAMSIDNLLNGQDEPNTEERNTPAQPAESSRSQPTTQRPPSPKRREVVTSDDLDDAREKVRSNLIERCLDVLNVHHDVTFELADLIGSATAKLQDPVSFRREVGETLMHSLISLQMEENSPSGGKKIAAYASLLALVLQDKEVYEATLEDLKDNFSSLLGFIKIPPVADKASDESCPWIPQILLILERILSDDAIPTAIRWNPPNPDGSAGSEEPAEVKEPVVPLSDKMELFEAIVDILPRISKDEPLALSVARILVILTRERDIAVRLGEKRNLQRLFVMIKQLASASDDRLQNAFMVILRHIIEDDDTIRQIMRSEIVSGFESRSPRQTDTTGYTRQFAHLVLRSPALFVEVTNEKFKLQRYDSHQRPQVLVLKSEGERRDQSSSRQEETGSAEKPEGSEAQNEPQGGQASESKDAKEKEKGKVAELKTPIVEHPDGVIHYLLSELLSYRDVDDKEPPSEAADKSVTSRTESGDVEMTSVPASPTSSTASSQPSKSPKKAEKAQFKADEHPIYIYRCFLLQCLTELLSSYNRTKVEFINFSRKADPFATTPSKPRSGILNYLLTSLVPIGTLEHEESINFKKRANTSNWAMRVIVALCTKTGEFGGPARRRAVIPDEDDEPELLFVRKFVLEHALKSYKDANASNEPLDAKYARLLSLADLFDKMLAGPASIDGTNQYPASTRQVAKTMFEKNFISAFTASISDIDLNFPSAKRAVKYILRPLNKLTQTAVLLSETSSIQTTPGQTDEDEISSATSVSDVEDEREETPDLFRHSTLGMFEPNHEEGTSSEESEDDEEMYDDEYDDEMDYEEDMPENDGEVVSDEDEEDIDGRGPIEGLPGDSGMDIEVLIEGDEDDEDDDEDDDDDETDEDEDDDEGSSGMDDDLIAGEITGDNDNDSLQDGDEGEWESEDVSTNADEDDMNHLDSELDDFAQGDHQPHFNNLLRVLEEAGGTVDRLESDMGIGREHDDLMDDDLHDEEDEDEEVDELEDELDDMEDDMRYPAFEDDGNPPWIFQGTEAPIGIHRHHHHGRYRGIPPPPWSMFTAAFPNRHGIIPIPGYRTHRNQIPQRGNDDGTNPLLRRSDRPADSGAGGRGQPEAMSDWVHAIDPSMHGNRLLAGDGPVSFMNAIMQAIGQSGPGVGVVSRPDGIHVRLDQGSVFTNRIQDLFGLGRQPATTTRSRDDPSQAVTFTLTPTSNRWQEEARLLFSGTYTEKAQRIINSLLKILVPPAVEEEKVRQKQLDEERKRREEERAERERQERIAKEEAEKEKKRKEEEEEALRRQEEAERAERAAEERAQQAAEHPEGEPMDDVQPTSPAQEPVAEAPQAEEAEQGPSETAPRMTTIRGRQLDISSMDIDPEYLEALPEDIREEVIMQQVAEQRSQAVASGEEPSEINPEFLEALPADIREELLQQEMADRRRREREAARRNAAANGGPQAAEDMDAASFIATLDPSLRQTVLADQPEEILATLGPEFVNEARALAGRRLAQYNDMTLERQRDQSDRDQAVKKPQRHQIVQMLDKAGVATLLRLMFMPLQGNARHHLNDILHNVCRNRQNRTEVLSLLLLILQDGSADVSAVERSFAHLSLRAKTPSSVQKTPQLKRTLSLPTPGANNDVTPLIVIQQCLGALSFLTQYNPHIAWFFLTEHETTSALKMKALRKGKAKENRAAKFAINSLLSLLDRKSILDSPSCMEQLSSLLSSITQPLTLLLRKDKEKQENEAKEKEAKEKQKEGEEALPSTEEPPAESVESGAQQQAEQPAESTVTTEEVAPNSDMTMPDASVTVQAGGHPAGQEEAAGPSAEDKGEPSKPTEEDDKQKKTRIPEPPVVPEHNLRLVVHILAARECNGKTFRETLSTINNLSSIPGAREVFGKELIAQTQTLSQSILVDLDELLPHIDQAETGIDVQGMALSKFSPASSDQAKLLRVLTALDYLFDPNRIDREKHSEQESPQKEDVLKTLYEGATFGPLWAKLSKCLHAIQQKENMLNVATILLPLIESLMVVCKNTTLKDAPLSRHGREYSVSSPPPESGMEGLFFNFTEDHRRILNELVRQNPKLMSGTFSLLVKNPKVLEFDNKRNYFTRRIHSRGTETRHPHPPLQLSVRRDQVFLDSFKSLYFKSANEMKYGKLNIRFHGEEGVDAGGVTREWFQVLARGMFNPNYALFIPVASDRTTFHPNRLSGVNQEHLLFFKFIGRIIGKALYEGRVLDCHFSRAVYKRMLGKSVSIKDMETLDLDYYKSLLWMLENDITDIITENFSVESDDFGEKQIIDLIENGRNIPVTQENKEEYVQLVVEYRLTGSVKDQLDNFLTGFHDIIPADLIAIFNEQELELLISGLPEIDVDDWKNNAEYHNYSASSPQIQWFWRAVRSFDKEERAKLLQFVTGTSKVPLNGFKELEGMNGFSKFNIHRDYGNKDRLPSSHTCFNQLDLPEYDSYETLRQRLYTAMTAGGEYFGFA